MTLKTSRSLRGKAAIVGIGETAYYKHGKSPVSEFELALQAILAACKDAGLDPHEIDGFSGYSDDRNDSTVWPRHSEFVACELASCSGEVVAVDVVLRLPMQLRQLQAAWLIALWLSGLWRKASLEDLDRRLKPRRFPARSLT